MAKTIRCRLQNGSIVIVEIGEDMTVAHLQQRIKNRAKIALAAYDAHQLTLHLARVNNQWLNTTSGDDVFRQQVQDGNTVMDPDDQTNCCNHCSQVAVPDERANLIERTPVIVDEQGTPASLLHWCSAALGSTLGWLSATKSSSPSLQTKNNQ
ncbi:hypothetical protein PF005_g24004 [Phytophthora fragariae]|uniref:Crinkler effector protein N-terminal domain-containing protein n=1 Tax=Phytophthora fragariae TaxID=53985 RepID=A0A6A3IHG2_9STRA|nr:hypothetical protein PF009_g26083 [Phytophthora fragariae]KAE8979584.1 hypothetical protein PF011_g22787 [Phytophthora fragariae]KAE9074691.1 hypothetical protein PF007_g25309 [Phytophthora fragariae]KAE9077423.1 hypothetical protein PF010_g23515 [Phytophthora fragariae]KAE9092781.1 hypothetical protein PF006_g24603 [Phytophthora fragariae]